MELTTTLDFITLDIGGSLIKIAYCSHEKKYNDRTIKFAKFETKKIVDCIEFMKNILSRNNKKTSLPVIRATGGGSVKYQDLLESELQCKIYMEDEMECLISGLNFLLNQFPYEAFTYSETESIKYDERMHLSDHQSDAFPFLLVNIGSGVSIIKVMGPNLFQRISGTSLGGGTFWGLLCLLLKDSDYSFDEMLKLSQQGNSSNVDMLVGDIYGQDYSKIGLKASTIASSFGKVHRISKDQRDSGYFHDQDIAKSMLHMISNNIGQISYLNAQIHNVKRIYFSGFFIRGQSVTMNSLSYAIDFWSKGKIKAYFLRHEGYLGSIGAMVKNFPGKESIEQEALWIRTSSNTEIFNNTANNAQKDAEKFCMDFDIDNDSSFSDEFAIKINF